MVNVKSKFNKIIESNNHAEIIIESKIYGTKIVKIDKEDVFKIKNYCWCLSKSKNDLFYVYCTELKERLHRFIIKCPKGKVVDHINHNTLDNRKENLKICTTEENSRNTKWYKNNKTGCKNISYSNGKFIFSITKDKKQVIYKRFNDLEQAKKYKKNWEKKEDE